MVPRAQQPELAPHMAPSEPPLGQSLLAARQPLRGDPLDDDEASVWLSPFAFQFSMGSVPELLPVN